MLVPLYGFLQGDTIGLLVLAHDDWTVEQVIERLRASASVRVAHEGEHHLVHRGLTLDKGLTVAQSGIQALDRIDVRRGKA